MESEIFLLIIYGYHLRIGKRAGKEHIRQRILAFSLDRLTKRTRTILGIIALLRQFILSGFRYLQANALLSKLGRKFLKHKIHDLTDLFRRQLMEDYDLIDTVEEFRTEHLLQNRSHWLSAMYPHWKS